jgi:hypothetical protein
MPRRFWPEFVDLPPRLLHGTDEFVGPDHKNRLALACGTFRILQRETEFLRQVVYRRSLPLPGTVGLEAQRADTPAPRRDDAANRAIVRTVGVMLIDLLDHVRRDADERAQRGGRLDAVLPAVPRRLEDACDLLEVVDEELLGFFSELFALAGAAKRRFVSE